MLVCNTCFSEVFYFGVLVQYWNTKKITKNDSIICWYFCPLLANPTARLN